MEVRQNYVGLELVTECTVRTYNINNGWGAVTNTTTNTEHYCALDRKLKRKTPGPQGFPKQGWS
jgi:hypothetical protein